jgi:four helix bundle protein
MGGNGKMQEGGGRTEREIWEISRRQKIEDRRQKSEGRRRERKARRRGFLMETVRAKAKSFQDLVVWKKAHDFVLGVYVFTRSFPKEELYGLTSQLRRAAVSVPANIAEGFKKVSKADKARFFNIAQGSLEESKYYLILARDLEYGDSRKLSEQAQEVSKLLESYTQCVLHSTFCLLSSVFCLLSSVFCLLSSVFCLLSSVFCLLT